MFLIQRLPKFKFLFKIMESVNTRSMRNQTSKIEDSKEGINI
jgi:hypothetical protein